MMKYLMFGAAALALGALACNAAPFAGDVQPTAEVQPTVETLPAAATPTAQATQPVVDAPAREAFHEWDVTTEPMLAGFNQGYAAAVAAGEAWTQDPQAVALRLAVGAEPEQAPDVLEVERTESTAIYLITLENLLDDSVHSRQVRVELENSGGVWKVLWFGERWKCQPGRGQQDWAASLCA